MRLAITLSISLIIGTSLSSQKVGDFHMFNTNIVRKVAKKNYEQKVSRVYKLKYSRVKKALRFNENRIDIVLV